MSNILNHLTEQTNQTILRWITASFLYAATFYINLGQDVKKTIYPAEKEEKIISSEYIKL